MSRFFVGQRVRLGRTANCPELVGGEYRIVRLNVPAWAEGLGDYIGHALNGTTPWGRQLKVPPDWLEPIIPEGMQPAKWENCMWQPQTEQVAA